MREQSRERENVCERERARERERGEREKERERERECLTNEIIGEDLFGLTLLPFYCCIAAATSLQVARGGIDRPLAQNTTAILLLPFYCCITAALLQVATGGIDRPLIYLVYYYCHITAGRKWWYR